MATLNTRYQGAVSVGGESSRWDILRSVSGLTTKIDRIVNLAADTSLGSETTIWQGSSHGSANPSSEFALLVVFVDPDATGAAVSVDIGIGITDDAGAVTERVFRASKDTPLVLPGSRCGSSFTVVASSDMDRVTRIRGRNPNTTAGTNDIKVRVLLLA